MSTRKAITLDNFEKLRRSKEHTVVTIEPWIRKNYLVLELHLFIYLYINSGEGNGNPLQYSCLENPVDRGAWWAAVHRVPQSQARLKRLSMYACIGEGNGNPLQCPCLENPRDRGARWAAIYGVAQSRTRLKRLSSSTAAAYIASSVVLLHIAYPKSKRSLF